MAITKLLRIKETAGKNKASHLKANVFYICKSEKTNGGKWIGGNAGLSPEQIYKTFINNKNYWNKTGGSQGFHYMLSFPPELNISEELVYQITQEFCEELLGDNYYHVFTVHNDKAHLHSHITFDSVSRTTGKKFHSPAGDWEKRIQPITNRLCKKYNLPTLQYNLEEKGVGKNYSAWESEKTQTSNKEDGYNTNQYTWYDIIRDDIDTAIQFSNTWEDFLVYLRNHYKYELRNGKYLSVKPYGKEKSVRTHQLGAGYSKQELIERIENKHIEQKLLTDFKTYGDKIYIQAIIQTKKLKIHDWKMKPFQKQFYQKWNYTYFIRKPSYSDTWKYKKDILRVHKLAAQLSYVIDHDIHSFDDAIEKKNKLDKIRKDIATMKSAATTKLNKHASYVDAKKLSSLEQELMNYPAGTRPDLESQYNQLKEKIDKLYPNVQSDFIGLNEKIASYNDKLKEINEELKILSRITSTDLEIPNQKKYWKQLKEKHGGLTRITINEKLFHQNFCQDKFYITRIPFSKKYVKFPVEFSQLQNGNSILSTYIYDKYEYTLIDIHGNSVEKIHGAELKQQFEDKTKEIQINGLDGTVRNLSPMI